MKKGLSQIVTSILFILIILVAVGILWGVLRNFLLKSTDNQNAVNCLTASIKPVRCIFTGDSVRSYAVVRVQRGSDDSNFSDLRLLFNDSSSTRWSQKEFGSGIPKTYETSEATFLLGGLEPSGVSVSPAFSNGEVCSVQEKTACFRYTYQLGTVCSDFNGDGFPNGIDYDDYSECYALETEGVSSGANCIYSDPLVRRSKLDKTGDGVVTSDDYLAFTSAYVLADVGGC